MIEKRLKIERGDYQTPSALAEAVCSLLCNLDVRPRTVIEPTCGEGSLLRAAAQVFGGGVEYFGFDISSDYIATAKRRMEGHCLSPSIHLQTQDFFTMNWKKFLKGVAEPILFLGNPPWVTSAALGALDSDNLPEKSNMKSLSGLDALTGKANFDLSEWMLLKLAEAARGRDYVSAMLCKTGVARKVLEYQWRTELTVRRDVLYRIDAARWFEASVDACLFVSRPEAAQSMERSALVHDSLDPTTPTVRFGVVDGKLVSDMDAHRGVSHLNGVNYYRWRSGVKHDLAKIMELVMVEGRLRNGLGETVDIEESCLYPLLKASDVAKGVFHPTRYVVVTQNSVGGDTDHLRESAPRAWDYLEQREALFSARKSSIYREQPRFCMFGIGPYSFAPYKVVVSGLHKTARFNFVPPFRSKPVLVDDTCYFVGSDDRHEACLLQELLASVPAQQFFQANVFLDSKRPMTANVLNRLDIKKLAEHLGRRAEIEAFIQSGNIEAQGQGLLVFEPAQKYKATPRRSGR